MGKASSSKKVQRAARAAASSRGVGESRERGFPMLVGLVIILGIGLVLAARSSRPELVAPLLEDHWHSAYEVYDCGTAMPSIQDVTDPDGIHTHGDGLIHIHPFNSSATGTDARLQVFFDATGLRVSESAISSPEYPTIDAATGCGDGDAVIKVARWSVDGPDGLTLATVYTSDFGNIRLLDEREAFTFAKVPVGEDPPEPSAAVLAQLDASTGTTNIEAEPLDLSGLDLGSIPITDGTVTDGSVPTDTAPTDTAPTDTAPTDTAPTDTAPTDTVPEDSVPETDETVPATTEPASG